MDTEEIYQEEIWISGNQRSAPQLNIEWSTGHVSHYGIQACSSQQELADQLRKIASDIESEPNLSRS